jgi:hypothetical protein
MGQKLWITPRTPLLDALTPERLMVAKGATALVLVGSRAPTVLLLLCKEGPPAACWAACGHPDRPPLLLLRCGHLLGSGTTPSGPWNRRKLEERATTASVPLGSGSAPTGLVGARAMLVANSSPCSLAS